MDKTSIHDEPTSEAHRLEGVSIPVTCGELLPEVGPVLDDSEDSKDAETSGDDEVIEDYPSDEDNFLLKSVSSIVIGELPMPDATEFSVPLPSELQRDGMVEILDVDGLADKPARSLALPPKIVHVSEILNPMPSGGTLPSVDGVQVAHVGVESGLTGDLQATYLRLRPGTRTSRPFAQRLGDSITYCISGRGLVWQNGWTFPFEATDCAGWKGGTGVAHTIINDSNRDGTPGEDLVLITAHEVKQGEAYFYPLDPDIQEINDTSGGHTLWKDPPAQGDLGPHPGIPSVSLGSTVLALPEPLQRYRPSNVVNAIAELEGISSGELFANVTCLTQETGLSGRFGCNFEVPPPGTRSSDPHAHSLEDELVFVVSGSGLVWINGNVQPVREGDAVGFPGGTGIAHNFINDSNAEGAEGEPLFLWIIGQNRVKEGDLVYYPLHIEEKSKSKRWWAGES